MIVAHAPRRSATYAALLAVLLTIGALLAAFPIQVVVSTVP